MNSNANWHVDDLVSYLDGELDAEEARRVEALLASDPAARAELARLERAWDLLDELPAAGLHEGFTRSTVEMVAVAAEADAVWGQQRRSSFRRRTAAAALCSLLLAAAGGYLGAASYWPDRNARLRRDLPVLWHHDAYLHAGDIDFVRQLAREELFGAQPAALGEGGQGKKAPSAPTPADRLSAPPPDPPADLAALTEDDKHDLARTLARFDALTEQDRERVRRLHEDLQADPRRDELYRAIYRYDAWLRSLPLAQRTRVLDFAPAERAEKIAADLKRRPLATGKVSPRDQRELVQWLFSRLEAFVEKASPQFGDRWRLLDVKRREEIALQLAANGPQSRLAWPRPMEIEALLGSLSPTLQNAWQEARAAREKTAPDAPPNGAPAAQPRGFQPQRQLLAAWLRSAARQELADRELAPWRLAGHSRAGAANRLPGEQPPESVPPEAVALLRMLRQPLEPPSGAGGPGPRRDRQKAEGPPSRTREQNRQGKSKD